VEPVLRRFRPPQAEADEGVLDIDQRGRIQVTFVQELRQQLSLALRESGWTESALIAWLDRNALGTTRSDIPQPSSLVFISRVLRELGERAGWVWRNLLERSMRIVPHRVV